MSPCRLRRHISSSSQARAKCELEFYDRPTNSQKLNRNCPMDIMPSTVQYDPKQ